MICEEPRKSCSVLGFSRKIYREKKTRISCPRQFKFIQMLLVMQGAPKPSLSLFNFLGLQQTFTLLKSKQILFNIYSTVRISYTIPVLPNVVHAQACWWALCWNFKGQKSGVSLFYIMKKCGKSFFYNNFGSTDLKGKFMTF
jgi:hypothetical protein